MTLPFARDVPILGVFGINPITSIIVEDYAEQPKFLKTGSGRFFAVLFQRGGKKPAILSESGKNPGSFGETVFVFHRDFPRCSKDLLGNSSVGRQEVGDDADTDDQETQVHEECGQEEGLDVARTG